MTDEELSKPGPNPVTDLEEIARILEEEYGDLLRELKDL